MRPEFLPGSDVPAHLRKPDDRTREWLLLLTDESLSDERRGYPLQACHVRGGASAAAADFIVKTPGPAQKRLQHIARATGVLVDRPAYSHAEHLLALCFVAGGKGLPLTFRHRAADALVEQAGATGYVEARSLLPKNGWNWLVAALREGRWGLQTAELFVADGTAPLRTRMDVGLALIECHPLDNYIPDSVAELVGESDAPSSSRLALAAAAVRRAPQEGADLLSHLAEDAIMRAGHRRQAIDLLDAIAPNRATRARALQMNLPSARSARESLRTAKERMVREAAEQLERQQAEAVAARLDAEIEELVNDLRSRGSADFIAESLDDHLVESDLSAVQEDIADMCGLVLDQSVEDAIRLLGVLVRIRTGADAPEPGAGAPVADLPTVPQLTVEEVEAYARETAEKSWRRWESILAKHGWDDDQFEELDRQREDANRESSEGVRALIGDHLRTLHNRLLWEVWPALTDSAEAGSCAQALSLLATARLLTEEASRAGQMWGESLSQDHSFDPMTLSWPRGIWLVLEQWNPGSMSGGIGYGSPCG